MMDLRDAQSGSRIDPSLHDTEHDVATQPIYILAPYVPTAPDVVERMLELAKVSADDLVCDLGCGDGRLAIAAAVTRGARAFGVDIEPYWVDEARKLADAAGVADRVSFAHEDALSVDIRPATVVFLYLVHWSTQRVARELLGRCAPGTRVVSNSFPFEAVNATATETFIDASGHARSIYLWVVPAGAPEA
jgi:SAM-dependent methyltransferase